MRAASRAAGTFLLGLALGACRSASSAPAEPIDGFPTAQQETISRNLWREWPLTVGTGTLGCDAGAVAFRAGGRTYAVNDAARARGLPSIDAILALEPSPKPTNPLSRITQETRMKVFEEAATCEARDDACRTAIRTRYQLTESEFTQVDAEGRERVWPPLKRKPASTRALLDRGLALCK